MHHQRVRTYGPHQVITDIVAEANRQLELVEFEIFDFLGQKVHVFHLDQAAAATHAEQVNVALREVEGGELVATAISDEYRVIDGGKEKVGFVLPQRDVSNAAPDGGELADAGGP